jgi:O-antigen/teichoic acid export membrane protein
LPFIVHYGLLPPLSQYFISNRKKHSQLSAELVRYVLILTLPMSFILAQYAGLIINGLFGNDFLLAIPAFKILMVSLFFTYLIVIFNCILISMDRLKPILYLAALGLMVNVISNLMLIPKFGYLGAAYSTAFSEMIVFAATMMYLDKVNKKLMLAGKTMRFCIAAVIIALILIMGETLRLSAVFVMGICAIAYALSLMLLKLIDMRSVGALLRHCYFSKSEKKKSFGSHNRLF